MNQTDIKDKTKDSDITDEPKKLHRGWKHSLVAFCGYQATVVRTDKPHISDITCPECARIVLEMHYHA